jgi:hypothetical protein
MIKLEVKTMINKTVNLNLVGLNSDAYSIINAFKRQAQEEGWTEEEIEEVITKARSGNYAHFISTIDDYCIDDSEDEEDDYYYDEEDEYSYNEED